MATLSYLTQIQFDHGAIKHLGKGMQRLNMQRPLIVSGPNLSSGSLARQHGAVFSFGSYASSAYAPRQCVECASSKPCANIPTDRRAAQIICQISR